MVQDETLQVVTVEEPEKQTFSTRIARKVRKTFRNQSSSTTTDPLLQGTTLKIYWYLLTHLQGMAGIREIQKTLELSSPGTVSYHINKLIKAGIVSKNEHTEKYYVKEEVKSGVLGLYFRLGHRMVPRFTFYLMIFILATLSFLIFLLTRGDPYILDPSNWVFLFVLIFGIVVFIYESLKIWKIKSE